MTKLQNKAPFKGNLLCKICSFVAWLAQCNAPLINRRKHLAIPLGSWTGNIWRFNPKVQIFHDPSNFPPFNFGNYRKTLKKHDC